MLGTFWEHLETKTASQISEKRFSVPPTGIEPISTEPESVILSIELRRQNRTAHKVATFSALLQIFVLFSAEKERENYLQGGCRCRKPAEKFFASFLYQILLDASCRLAVRALFRGRMACDNH